MRVCNFGIKASLHTLNSTPNTAPYALSIWMCMCVNHSMLFLRSAASS